MESFYALADRFKALADPTRLKIIALLKRRDFCVCELVPLFGISQPAVSKHLSRLKQAGFVEENRKGQWVFYSLNQAALEKVGISLHNLPDMSDEVKKLEENGLRMSCE